MAGIYKLGGRLGGREWVARDAIRYVSPQTVKAKAAVSRGAVFIRVLNPPVAKDVATRFEALAQQWQEETRHLSSITQIVLNSAYQQLIGLGPAALPLIFQKLLHGPHHWFWALNAITGENPVAAEDVGNLPRMREAWIRWGRDHGYVE